MDIVTRQDIEQLIARRDGACISIYMPAHRAGQDIQQDSIRLKNLLKQAEGRLLESGWRTPDVQNLLEPAQNLVSDGGFWRHQSDGLAIFLSSEGEIHYRIPRDFEELVVVADRFHVKPLLPFVSEDERFYILTLSQDEVKLLDATRYAANLIDLGDTPTSLEEALQWDDPEAHLQFHSDTVTPGGRGERPSAFHGHGVGVDTEDENIRRFCHRVDEGVRAALQNENIPMVLVGVEPILSTYREANAYPHLMAESVRDHPDSLSVEEIHEKALALVEPLFEAKKEEAVDKYLSLAGSDHEKASDELDAIIWAAYGGRVESLFVPAGVHRWGTFDADENKIERCDEPTLGCEDLVDLVAAHAFANKGAVYVVDPDDVPGDGFLAAVFRY